MRRKRECLHSLMESYLFGSVCWKVYYALYFIGVIHFCLYDVSYQHPLNAKLNKTNETSKKIKIPPPPVNMSQLSRYNVSQSKLAGIKKGELSVDLIKPPDHLEGVKMERDGHLNKKFRKEVILGNGVNDEEKQNDNKILEDVFKKADVNRDGLLSQKELERWIATKVKEHFGQAIRDNFWIFSALDKNHDGRVSWDEYHVNFMMEQGFDEKYAKHHPEDHKGLQRKVKEKILLDKAAWSEAANSDPDALNIDEFLTFRHPEHSHVSLLTMVNDIISSLDVNGDEMLTQEEFAEIPPDDNNERSAAEWKRERTKEFHEVIDMNHDGKVSRQELLMYNDPENPVHARREARDLVLLADVNKDGFLSLDEIFSKKDIFLGSKMVDTARSFHDEF